MPRTDAQRNIDALLAAARDEFAEHGVDVGVRAIAARAGVGTATLYRHFPTRAQLIAAVFHHEIDDLVAEARTLAESREPFEALEMWLQRYTRFVAAKHGLSAALHSGDPAYNGLREHFEDSAGPALAVLLDRAVAAGAIHAQVDPLELLGAVSNLCVPPPGSRDNSRALRMLRLLLDGMRYTAR